jgi:hypothetical protein
MFTKYLGDAVYAQFDGHTFTIKTDDLDNPTEIVVMEPEVLKAFLDFITQVGKIVKEAANDQP